MVRWHKFNVTFIWCLLLIFVPLTKCHESDESFESEEMNSKNFNRMRPFMMEQRRNSAIVHTKDGILKGVRRDKRYSFLGIRYGQAPIGSRRFKRAIPVEPWKGEKSAQGFGSQCPQVPIITGRYSGNEDCLFLNVYVKEFPSDNELLPVMVWIHGGAFKGGGGDFPLTGPDYLVQENVVLVTINYRLGPIGFLAVNHEAPGNAGLHDQILALEWVQRNIESFAGDPKKVTIFGQSAGAVSVDALILSPFAKGLFHKAIAQSGSILNPWAVIPNPKDQAFKLGRALGFKGDNSNDLVEFLRDAPAQKLIEAGLKLEALPSERNAMGIFFTPVVEEVYDDMPQVLTQHPVKIFESGNYSIVPYLAGFTSDEGLIVFKSKFLYQKIS